MNPTFISPCFISGWFTKYSIAVIIAAIPALSSPPSNVVPSVTIISSPTNLFNSGVSSTVVTTPSSSFRTISFPS